MTHYEYPRILRNLRSYTVHIVCVFLCIKFSLLEIMCSLTVTKLVDDFWDSLHFVHRQAVQCAYIFHFPFISPLMVLQSDHKEPFRGYSINYFGLPKMAVGKNILLFKCKWVVSSKTLTKLDKTAWTYGMTCKYCFRAESFLINVRSK